MSYTITIYCNDAKIYKTSVKTTTPGNTYSGTYGSSSLGKWQEFSVSGISGKSTFTVEPKTGCSFYRWVYRVGSTDSDIQYSYDSSFVYSGTSDIYIRAEGKTDTVDTPWHPWSSFRLDVVRPQNETYALGYYDFYTNEDVDGIGEYQIHYGPVTFYKSGYAHFYSSAGRTLDVIGFLSDSPESAPDWSEPASILAYDDNSGGYNNFNIEYYVHANTEYYLFVRGATGTETGSVSVTATVPWELDSRNYGTLSGVKSEKVYCEPYTFYRRALTCTKKGTLTVHISGDVRTYGGISLSSGWDSEYGENFDNIDGLVWDGTDEWLSFDVEAGQQYYLWFKNLEDHSPSNVTIELDFAEFDEPTVEKWSWSRAQGGAAKAQVVAAYNAVNGKGATTDFHHNVWNAMVDKVKEILDYLGEDWNEYYDVDYAGTKITETPYELTAQKFNSLRYNIGFHYSTGIDEVESGDDVLGWYFTRLTDRINAWIDTL